MISKLHAHTHVNVFVCTESRRQLVEIVTIAATRATDEPMKSRALWLTLFKLLLVFLCLHSAQPERFWELLQLCSWFFLIKGKRRSSISVDRAISPRLVLPPRHSSRLALNRFHFRWCLFNATTESLALRRNWWSSLSCRHCYCQSNCYLG